MDPQVACCGPPKNLAISLQAFGSGAFGTRLLRTMTAGWMAEIQYWVGVVRLRPSGFGALDDFRNWFIRNAA